MRDSGIHSFQLGEWRAYPARNLLAGHRGEVHLEPKAMQVLQVLASAPRRVFSRDELNDAVWGGRAVSDGPLTHSIASLRHALGDSPKSPQYIQTIPKRGYRLICDVVALSLSATDEGNYLGVESVRGNKQQRSQRTHFLLISALGLIVVLAVSAFMLFKLTTAQIQPQATLDEVITADRPPWSLAVLPFEVIGDDPDAGYFGDGLTEEILKSVSQMPELQVTGRTSSFFFKNKDVSVQEIANSLDVAYVLDGSVRRNSNQYRIAARLIRVSDQFLMWSDSYDGADADIFQVQTDIAESVATALGVLLDDEARQRMKDMSISDVSAFVAYQKGLEAFVKAHHDNVIVADALTLANSFFDQVLSINPNLPAVRVLRADRANHALNYLVEGRREEAYAGEAKELAESLRTELEIAWRVTPAGNQRDILNVERTLAGDDWTGLAALIEIAMRPGNCPRINLLESLEGLGYASELVRKLRESLACNPLDPDIIGRLARAQVIAGRPEEAIALLDRVEGRGTYDRIFFNRRFQAMLAAGYTDEPEMQNFWSRRDFKLWQVLYEVVQGNHDKARHMIDQYWADPDRGLVRAIQLAALVGDRQRANDFAARIDSRPGSALSLVSVIRGCLWRPDNLGGCQDELPFDLDATPNFKARIDESGIPWPPESTTRH